MNGKAVKATRRELRRAIGPAVVDTVVETGRNVDALGRNVEGLGRQLRRLEQGLDGEQALRHALAAQFDAFESRGFFGRLAWLLFGR
jgi:hypothetical protein